MRLLGAMGNCHLGFLWKTVMSNVQTNMVLETMTYEPSTGWSVHPFPLLDSDRTLVLVFGATSYIDNQGPIAELRNSYPRARFLGCSTAGEIHGASLTDDSLSVAICRFEHTALVTANAAISSSSGSFAGL